jgi:hypothetical protein
MLKGISGLAVLAIVGGGGLVLAMRYRRADRMPPSADASVFLPAGWSRCQNPTWGSVGHPGSWREADVSQLPDPSRIEGACRWFDPDRIKVEPGTEGPLAALEVGWLEVASSPRPSFEEVVESFTDPRFWEVQYREKTSVAGHPAVRIEVTATGEGLDRVGTKRYGYLIDLKGRGFLVLTSGRPETAEEFALRKQVVDTAVSTLAFLETP